MAKSWIALTALIVLTMLAFGGIWLFSILKAEEPIQLYPATINRDCAPWDGMASTVSIPWKDAATINISIYQSLETPHSITFSFPDKTMRIGNAYFLPSMGSPEQLAGRVFFERIEVGKVVEGRFDLNSERGEKYKGIFRAEWGNEVVYCG